MGSPVPNLPAGLDVHTALDKEAGVLLDAGVSHGASDHGRKCLDKLTLRFYP